MRIPPQSTSRDHAPLLQKEPPALQQARQRSTKYPLLQNCWPKATSRVRLRRAGLHHKRVPGHKRVPDNGSRPSSDDDESIIRAIRLSGATHMTLVAPTSSASVLRPRIMSTGGSSLGLINRSRNPAPREVDVPSAASLRDNEYWRAPRPHAGEPDGPQPRRSPPVP